MRIVRRLAVALAVVMTPAGLQAQPPSLVLDDGGIEFPDGSLLDSAEAVNPPATLTVAVDCAAGDSIGAALEKHADELIIEISGFCNEDIDVRRDDVTFQGTDSSTDGFSGPSPGSDDPLLVYLENASGVTFRNLTFANSNKHGLFARASQLIVVENCLFQDNAGDGVLLQSASQAKIEDSSFERNGRFGLTASGASSVNAIDSVFVDNAGWAVASFLEGTVYVSGTACSVTAVATDTNGLTADVDGFIAVSSCSINVPNGIALWAIEQSDLSIRNTTFVGDLVAERKSVVLLGSTEQTATGPDGNRFAHDSTMVMTFGDVELAGTTTFDTFSTGSIEGTGTYVFDVLLCKTGGDMACGAPTPASNSGSTGCGFCP